MVYTPHNVVKPEKLVETAVALLEQELVLPNLFQKESFDNYKGARGDAVNIKVEGLLPFHEYAFRNDRSEPIQRDVYEETTIQVTLAGHFYSNVAITDEQRDFDLMGWGPLLTKQTRAVGRGLQRQAAQTVADAPFEVTIGGAEADLRGALTEANRVFDRFQVPDGQRTLIVGSDFQAAMENDPTITLAANVGDAAAESALRGRTVGMIKGLVVVVDNSIQPDAAYAFVDGGFIWANAAPTVPGSVGYGATASFEGVSLRMVQNYVHGYVEDQQLVDTWSGMRYHSDHLVGWDASKAAEFVSAAPHFVRGIKLTLGGESAYPEVDSELATLTGITAASGWEAGARKDLSI